MERNGRTVGAATPASTLTSALSRSVAPVSGLLSLSSGQNPLTGEIKQIMRSKYKKAQHLGGTIPVCSVRSVEMSPHPSVPGPRDEGIHVYRGQHLQRSDDLRHQRGLHPSSTLPVRPGLDLEFNSLFY